MWVVRWSHPFRHISIGCSVIAKDFSGFPTINQSMTTTMKRLRRHNRKQDPKLDDEWQLLEE